MRPPKKHKSGRRPPPCPVNGRFTAGQIAEACGGHVVRGQPDVAASAVSTDTRALTPGQAFFALVGPNHDAHEYLPQAAAMGAPVLVAERLEPDWQPPEGAAVVQVDDTAAALLALAAWHRRRLRGTVAAVTGSCGKSTVKNMLGVILGSLGRCMVAPASFNNRIGVALTLLSASREEDFVVLEMGTNHPGEIAELARAARPDLGVITTIAAAHLEGLGSLEGVREAKAELIPHIRPDGTLVLNADDPPCASLADRFPGTRATFGLNPEATVRPDTIRASSTGWTFTIRRQHFHLNVGGRYNVLNAAAAVCAAEALGAPLETAAKALGRFRLSKLHHERRDLGGCLFVLDCYNSNPTAMRAALQSFMLEPNVGRRVVVCGDMLELGQDAPRYHRELGAHLASSGADLLVAVGSLGGHVVEGWSSRAAPSQEAVHFDSPEAAWRPLWSRLHPGDAVLLKGSRGIGLEAIVERIAEHLDTTGKEAAA